MINLIKKLSEHHRNVLIGLSEQVIDNPQSEEAFKQYLGYRNNLVLESYDREEIGIYDEIVKEARV